MQKKKITVVHIWIRLRRPRRTGRCEGPSAGVRARPHCTVKGALHHSGSRLDRPGALGHGKESWSGALRL